MEKSNPTKYTIVMRPQGPAYPTEYKFYCSTKDEARFAKRAMSNALFEARAFNTETLEEVE